MAENKHAKQTDRRKKNRNKKVNGWRLVLIIFLAMTIIGAGTGIGVAYSYIKDTPPLNMDNFSYIEPSVVLDINGDFYQELQGKEKREVVSIEQIPDYVQNAFISIEDERFKEHPGVDIWGIAQGALQGIKAGDLTTAGGSTITQQLIKLTHLSPEKTLKRKVQEAYLAIQLERTMTKEQILEAYLNKINFAYAHGIQAAAQTYFRTDIEDLSIAQAAVLAAIPKAPSLYKPYLIEEKEDGSFGIAYEENGETLVHSSRNRDRALTVLGKMKELGNINEKQYSEAKNQIENNEFGLVEPPEPAVYSYFTDEVYDQVLDDLIEEYDYTEEEATSYLINGGLTIHATIDPKVQSALNKNFENDNLFPGQSSTARQASQAKSQEMGQEVNFSPEGAMVVIDNDTGYIAGIVGGRDKEKSRSLNRATQSKFQPGSSTKPLTVYAPGIDSKKITLANTYDDIPIQIRGTKISNAGGYRGMTTVRDGLSNSINTIAVQALYDVGIQTSVEYGEKFGLEFVEADKNASPLALGGYTHGQTPLAMASAFSAFPNGGVRTEPIFYTKVEDPNGNIVLENKSDKGQVISPQTAYLITDVLKDVVRGGTTNISIPRMEVAGKTGTTNNLQHAWFVGYTPKYTASVWYGYDKSQVNANGKTYHLNIGVYGGSKPGPAGMWESVMRDIHQDLESQSFPGNPGGLVSAKIDSVSGLSPTELSYKDPRGTVISELFISGTAPTQKDNYHVQLEIDTSSNKIATEYCPPQLVKSKVFVQKPEDRFPGDVRPIDPNYVGSREKDVLAPAETCDIHSESGSVFQLQISAPKDAIEINEQVQLGIKGNTNHGKSLKILEAEFSTDSDIIQIVDANAGIIKGVKKGNADVTATVSFKYNGEEYTDIAKGSIQVVEESQDVELNILEQQRIEANQYRITLAPSLKNYSGDFNISFNPKNMQISESTISVQPGSSKTIDVDVTGKNASLGVTISANGQSNTWNLKGFEYEKESSPDENPGEGNGESDNGDDGSDNENESDDEQKNQE